jgi:cytochrome c-type biogenesis protein
VTAAGPTILQAAGAGVVSVFSKCALPVVPVLVAGAGSRGARRPALLATGLALSFLLMGVLSSLRGDLLVGRTRALELAGTTVIMLVGLAGACGAFRPSGRPRCAWAAGVGEGAPGGAVLGLALGLVWVPCIGPVLSEILGAVGTPGELTRGLLLLAAYSAGLALPLLIVTLASRAAQRGLTGTPRREAALRLGSSGVLVAFWLYQVFHGNLAY